jgi:glycosyltransferase involved in cell wall biosynthesis
MTEQGFSVILCTYNGEKRLQPTLNHLASLTIPAAHGIELIVVNNASTDNTESFVKKIWMDLGSPYCLNFINEERAGKGYALETGYDAARYSFLLTVDDDNWLDAGYLIKALEQFEMDKEIGALQAKSTAVFESTQPEWMKQDGMEHYFVIGGPIKEPGYFPNNNFGTWGAGMIIKKEDWQYLRTVGFGFLTSKLHGKAAGEDHELARALLMMGRKFYYSDELKFQHYMPAERLTWEKLKQNFATFGYVSYYNFLFAMTLEALQKSEKMNVAEVKKSFLRYFFVSLKNFTVKQHIAYWLYPQKQYYQLKLFQYFSNFKWFFKLKKNAGQDIRFLQNWMKLVLEKYPGRFEWPGHPY